MGRDTTLYVFIGRRCSDAECDIIEKLISRNMDYRDYAHILELDSMNPFLQIGDETVVLITNNNEETWYVCEKFISYHDTDYEIELDTNIGIKNKLNKLLVVSETTY